MEMRPCRSCRFGRTLRPGIAPGPLTHYGIRATRPNALVQPAQLPRQSARFVPRDVPDQFAVHRHSMPRLSRFVLKVLQGSAHRHFAPVGQAVLVLAGEGRVHGRADELLGG